MRYFEEASHSCGRGKRAKPRSPQLEPAVGSTNSLLLWFLFLKIGKELCAFIAKDTHTIGPRDTYKPVSSAVCKVEAGVGSLAGKDRGPGQSGQFSEILSHN